MVIAVIQLMASAMSSTSKSERQYSPVLSFERPMAPKARIAMAVEPSSGTAVWVTMSFAAFMRSDPRWMAMSMPSVMTMALSTSITRAMMRAPSEMRSSVSPQKFITIIVPQIVMSRIAPIIRPLRSPMKMRRTMMTITTAWARFITKSLIDSVTVSAWNEILCSSTPSGIFDPRLRMWRWTASPMVTTLPPLTVEIPSPTAGLPS